MDTNPEAASPTRCARCGARFACGMRSGHCWCEELPTLPDPNPAKGCYCPACLKALATQAPAGAADN